MRFSLPILACATLTGCLYGHPVVGVLPTEDQSAFPIALMAPLLMAPAESGTDAATCTVDDPLTFEASSESGSYLDVAYGNGVFVAVGIGITATSTDGKVWVSQATPEANLWSGIIYGGGQFVAVAHDGTSRVMTSTDGATWSVQRGVSGGWRAVAYGNGRFVAVGDGGTYHVMHSACN